MHLILENLPVGESAYIDSRQLIVYRDGTFGAARSAPISAQWYGTAYTCRVTRTADDAYELDLYGLDLSGLREERLYGESAQDRDRLHLAG